MECAGVPDSVIARSGWIVGQTHETLPMSVLPAASSGPWSSIPYAAALAIQRAARTALLFIVVAPPEKTTSTEVSLASAAASASAWNRRFIRS